MTLALTPPLRRRALLALVLASAAAATGVSAGIGRAGAGAHGQDLAGAFIFYVFIIGIVASWRRSWPAGATRTPPGRWPGCAG